MSLSSSNSLNVNVSSDSRNLTSLIGNLLVAAAIDLPKDFASNVNEELSPNTTDDDLVDVDQCSRPVAVIFHIFKNSKLFQSASSERSNIALQSDLLLGDELKAVNSLVVSASLTDGLNTSHLETEMSFLLEERTLLVGHLIPSA